MLRNPLTQYASHVRVGAWGILALGVVCIVRFLSEAHPPILPGAVGGVLVVVAGTVLWVLKSRRHKASQAAARSSEQGMNLFFENTPDIVYRFNADDIYESVSPSVRRYGFEPQEIIGLHGSQMAADPGHWSKIVAERNRRGGLDDYDIDFRARDGRLVILSTSSRPIRDADGNIVGWHGIARDVTERRRLTDALVESRRQAEAASRAKSDFVANISHEIRTPLAGTLGMLEILLETELPPDVRVWAEGAKSSADTLAVLIDNVLDLAKIEAGAIELESIEFSLLAVLQPLLKATAIAAEQKGVEFCFRPAADLPRRFVGDPIRLRQIVSNLLSNAVKFTKVGSVTLSIHREARPDQRWLLHFEVADSGPGIPDEQQHLIFARFAQADTSVSREYGGTGLGLPICIELTELMKGRLWLESEVGKGSVFHVTAELGGGEGHDEDDSSDLGSQPASPGVAAPSSQPTGVTPPPPTALRVLLAEDSETVQTVVANQLRKRNCEVVVVGDGRQAVDAFTRQRFDLILMDVQMPVMDGAQATRAIRRLEPREDSPVMIVAMTGQAMPQDYQTCVDAGMDEHLIKPVRATDLGALLDRLTSKRAAVSTH